MLLKKKNVSTGQEFVLYGSWEEFVGIAATRRDLWVISVTPLSEGRIGVVYEPHTRTPSSESGSQDKD